MTSICVLLASLALAVFSPTTADHLEEQPGIISLRKARVIGLWHEGMVEERLNETVIPDIDGVLTTPRDGHLSLNISNIELREYSEIKSKVHISEDEGILVTLTAPRILLEGDIRVKTEGLLSQSGETNFTITLHGVTMTMERSITLLEDNLDLLWESSNTTASIDRIELTLHDERLNRLLKDVNEDQKKRFIVDLLTHPSVYHNLTTFKYDLRLHLTDRLRLNLALINKPKLLDGMIEMEHVGKVEYEGDSSKYPEKPADFDNLILMNHRALRISEVTFDSLGYFVHKHEMLSYTYTKNDLPTDSKDLLNMECSDQCFGKLFPKAKELHPDSTAVISVKTLAAPGLQIATNRMKLNVEFNIDVSAEKDGSEVGKLFTVHKAITASFDLVVKNNRLLFKLLHPESNTTITDSSIGNDLSNDDVNIVIDQAFQKVILPTVARMGVHGVDLKLLDFVKITQYEFLLKQHDLDIVMDVDSTKEKDLASLPTIELL